MSESPRWRPRFRLASLLWLMLCVALVIGTYRLAYERGREDTLAMRTFVGRTHVRSYDVQDVMPAKLTGTGVLLNFDPIVRDIQKEVLPNTWDGGSATISDYPNNISLIISHDADGHERIAAWLKQRRERLARSGTPTIASLAKKRPSPKSTAR